MHVPRVGLLLAVAVFVLTGCKPDGVTAARDQLGRGPSRTVQFTLPLVIDTLTIGEFLGDSGSGTDTTTTSSGITAVRFEPESLTVEVGDQLRFENLTFDAYAFSYDQMLETQQVSTSLVVPAPAFGSRPSMAGATVLARASLVTFDTPQGSGVSSATIASGLIVRTLTNGTNCAATVQLVLTDALGDTVAAFVTQVVAIGATLVDTVSAAGATVSQFVSVDPGVSFGACVPNAGSSVAVDVTFLPMTLAAVGLQNVNETFTENYAALAAETRIQAIDTVVAASGTLDLTVQNRLPIALTLNLTLQGITVGGATVQRTFNVPPAPGDGSTVQSVLSVDLTGATIVPPAVLAVVLGTATAANATVSAAVTTNAVTVDGGGSMAVDRLVGTLDPAQTPELTVAVETVEAVDAGAVDFGDFEDAIRGATINEATLTFAVTNGLLTPITLDSFAVGLALTDGAGNPRRDGGGNIVYQTDALGTPLLLTIAQPGQAQLLLPPGGNASVQLTTAAALLDRLVHLLIDDSSVALVGAGSAIVGDGVTVSRVDAADAIVINLALLVGLDLTLPDTGVVFSVTEVLDGLGLDSLDADDLASRLVDARATSDVVNGIPFGVEVQIALIAGDRGDSVDVFTLPGHATLSTASLAAATVNPATGRTTTATTGSVEEILDGADSRALFGERMTVTVRVRIRPPAGAGGRGAIVSGDPLIVNARASVTFTMGGAQ